MKLGSARLIHSTDHRLRLNLKEIKKKPELCDRLTEKLQQLPSIRGARINPVTGNVLIEFDGTLEEMLTDLSEGVKLSIYEKTKDAPKSLELALKESLEQVLKIFDFKIKQFTSGHLSLASVLILGLIGLGIRQSLKGIFLPSGLALFMKCYSLMEEK